ncbi:aspartate aminotransferase family protein [Mycobacterium sp. NPDC006124]|uniref:aspartate aminotransferase family protein n=1 Tax=Mycobacterium sp. NPDC006124 TaxID=3156729 RepID=UPI0033A6721B
MTSEPTHMANAYDGTTADQLDAASRDLSERRNAAMGPSYRLFYRKPVALERGAGVWLYDTEGNRFLDAYNNVPVIGHSHPRVQRLVADQLGLLNTHTRYLTESVVRYSERLLALFPDELSKVVYTCTGSEAVDLALRTARHHTAALGVVCTAHAYHGVTTAAAEISPSLGPNNTIPPHVVVVDAPDLLHEPTEGVGERFADRVREAVDVLAGRGFGLAAMIVDSVLSSDGVQCDPAGFLRPASDIVRAAGGLWIADEVQSGFGRLGAGWWGFARHGLAPDLVVLGKPMGNGVPIAAVVGRAEAMAKFGRDMRYFNTFGGNPVSIAAATAVLDVIEDEGLIDNARRTGAGLHADLQEVAQRYPAVGRVRGSGLFLAVEMVTDDHAPDPVLAADVVNGLRDRGILISASGRAANVLKIRPPLPFARSHAEQLASTLDGVLADLTSGRPRRRE